MVGYLKIIAVIVDIVIGVFNLCELVKSRRK
jgi:hypothetical protein